MEATADDISERLNRVYNVKGYMDKYGLDVWLTILLVLIFFLVITYFSIKNKLEPIKADWINQKCNPAVLPFAGLINAPKGMSGLEFTAQNFSGCIQQTLVYVADAFMAPIYYTMTILNGLYRDLIIAMGSVRAFFDKIRTTVADITKELFGRLLNLTIPLMAMQVKMRTVFSQVVGALTGTFYVLLGSFQTMKSLFMNIFNLLVGILIMLAITIIALFILSYVPIIGLFSLPALFVTLAAFIMIAIVVIIISLFLLDALKMSTGGIPRAPTGCFAPDTPIDLLNNVKKPIKDIVNGDLLRDGAVVTGVIQYDATVQQMYLLDGRVQVTGEHRVYLTDVGWIKVKDHPASTLVTDYVDPFVYCLLTESKVFTVTVDDQKPTIIFSDWDDMDDANYQKLKRNCLQLPADFDGLAHVHQHLDGGLLATTKVVKLDNDDQQKVLVNIADIKVGDSLFDSEQVVRVLGIVQILATDLPIVKYRSNGLIGSRNLLFLTDLGVVTNTLDFPEETFDMYMDENVDQLFHLLTSSGYFTVALTNEEMVLLGDYNTGLDKYLV